MSDSKHGVYRQVHGDHGLEEERLEVVSGVTDDVKEDGRHVDRHEGTFCVKINWTIIQCPLMSTMQCKLILDFQESYSVEVILTVE